jgi:hypothetical protein
MPPYWTRRVGLGAAIRQRADTPCEFGTGGGFGRDVLGVGVVVAIWSNITA